jgi:hypothetical protein
MPRSRHNWPSFPYLGSDGEAILTRMRDENLVLLGAEES